MVDVCRRTTIFLSTLYGFGEVYFVLGKVISYTEFVLN